MTIWNSLSRCIGDLSDNSIGHFLQFQSKYVQYYWRSGIFLWNNNLALLLHHKALWPFELGKHKQIGLIMARFILNCWINQLCMKINVCPNHVKYSFQLYVLKFQHEQMEKIAFLLFDVEIVSTNSVKMAASDSDVTGDSWSLFRSNFPFFSIGLEKWQLKG